MTAWYVMDNEKGVDGIVDLDSKTLKLQRLVIIMKPRRGPQLTNRLCPWIGAVKL
jgi:hypothetical protein